VIKPGFFLFVLVALCAGCTNVAVQKAPKADLKRYQRIFVEQPLNENHHVDEMLADELRRLGRAASSGPLTMMPENTDAVLSYHAVWSGDFSRHLTDLAVQLRTAHTNKPLAEGRYSQPSPRPKPADYVVRHLIDRVFGQ
jgi:hypothetical protein